MKRSKNQTKGSKKADKRTLPPKADNPRHKEDFEQLLNDAVLDVKKK
jgi:hypothetical protein